MHIIAILTFLFFIFFFKHSFVYIKIQKIFVLTKLSLQIKLKFL
jgi:hypothetical protein